MKNRTIQAMFLALFGVLLISSSYTKQKEQDYQKKIKILNNNQTLLSGISYLTKDALNNGLIITENQVAVVAAKSPEEEFFEQYGITLYEYEVLCKCVEAEAGITSQNAKRAVTEVILNRIDAPEYPNSIESVIFQPYQFEIINNGHYNAAIPSKHTKESVLMSLEERIYPANMLYFRDSCYFAESAHIHAYTSIDNLFFSVKQ